MTTIESNPSEPPAIILMIGDGMGLAQISGAIYSRTEPLAIELFPYIGFQKTHSSSNLVTDSAAGATAFSCGIKTYNNAIGVDSDSISCRNIFEEAIERGLSTGIIATSSITHATPASFVAHERHRTFYEQIAETMAHSEVDLFIGGGKQYFDRRDSDDQNLIDTMKSNGFLVEHYLNHDLDQVTPDINKKFAFFTADKQPLPVSQGRSYLRYASKIGSRFLHKKSSENGFILVIEGSQIDWANHANEGDLAIQETLDFDHAIDEVVAFAQRRSNTLVIVTADHESGGMAIKDRTKRGKVKTDFTTNGHTATMVPVYAYGDGAEFFTGIYENTGIYEKMRHFLGWE